MPGSVCESGDTTGFVNAALVKQLSGDVDKQVIASSKRVLLHDIDFVSSTKPHGIELNMLQSKYITVNPPDVAPHQPRIEQNGARSPIKSPRSDCLPSPKCILYPMAKVHLDWLNKGRAIGCGLLNLGNTCFLNATLQCLCHTPPLVNYLLSGEHLSSCSRNGSFCMMCELQRHAKRSASPHPIRPESILQKLHLISKNLQRGRQEDAHEFLRYVIDHLHRAALPVGVKLDRWSKATTVIDQIFGGYLRSQVKCGICGGKFNTFDPYMDIGLDIKNSPTIQASLGRFTQQEVLDNDNAYMCPKCKKKVRATKQLHIHTASNVLTIQLKRFDHTKMFSKINRHIPFPLVLNLRNYMSDSKEEAVIYHLYGVLVHSGTSMHMGHYYCFVKSPAGTWYIMNDAMVRPVPPHQVQNAEAYLLFYVKKSPSKLPPSHTNTTHKPQQAGESIPKSTQATTLINGPKPLNGIIKQSDIGVIVPRKMFIPNQVIKNQINASPSQQSTGTNLSSGHHKISFGVRPLTEGKEKTPVKYSAGLISGLGKKVSKAGKENEINEVCKNVCTSQSTDKVDQTIVEDVVDGKFAIPVKQDKMEGIVLESKLNTTTCVPGKSDLSVQDRGVGSKCASSENLPGYIDNKKNIEVGKDEQTCKKLVESHCVSERTICNVHKRERYDGSKSEKLDKNTVSQSKGQFGPSKNSERSNSVANLEKKPKIDALICNTSPQKVNASSHWLIQNQDCIKSPSISSNCSNTSVNSTTDWHVIETDAGKSYEIQKSLKDKRKFNVENRKFSVDKSNKTKTDTTDLLSQPKTKVRKLYHENVKEKEREVLDESKSLLKSADKIGDDGECKEKQNTSSSEVTDDRKHKDHESLLYKLFHKKKQKDEHGSFKFRKLTESDSSDSNVKKQMKIKPRHSKRKYRDNNDRESKRRKKQSRLLDNKTSKSWKRETTGSVKRKRVRTESDSSGEYHWVERTDFSSVESCTDGSETQLMSTVSGSKNGTNGSWLSERRTHELAESHRPRSPDLTLPENCSDRKNSDTTPRKMHKITGYQEKPLACVPTNGKVHQLHKIDGDNEKKVTSPTVTVPVKKWDSQPVRIDRQPDHIGNNNGSSDVATYLKNVSSVHGYGNAVVSWDGGSSKVDEDMASERHDHSDSSYNDEIDKGKTKKIKTRPDCNRPEGNVFQKFYDSRRESKVSNFNFSKKGDRRFKPKNMSPHFKERRF